MQTIDTENGLQELSDLSPLVTEAFHQLLGRSGADVHIRLCGPAMGHNLAMNYSAITNSIFDAITANTKGRLTVSAEDPAASAAHSIARAILMRIGTEEMSEVLKNDSQNTYQYLEDAIRIYPSKEPLDKLMTDEIDHEVVKAYFANYETLVEAEKGLLVKAAARFEPSFIPNLSLTNCRKLRCVDEAAGSFGKQDHTTVGRKLVNWIKEQVQLDTSSVTDGAGKKGKQSTEYDIVDFGDVVSESISKMPVVELIAIANFINSHLDAIKLGCQSVSSLEIVNCLAQAVNNHSSVAQNIPVPFEFREYTSLPLVTKARGRYSVLLNNPSFTGDHPSIWVGAPDDCPYTLPNNARCAVIAQSDCAMFAYCIGRFIISHVSMTAETGSLCHLSLDDLLVNYRAVLDENLFRETIYRTLRTQVKNLASGNGKIKLKMFEMYKSVIAMKHSQDNVAKFRKIFSDIVREDSKTFAKLIRDLIDFTFTAEIGNTVDKLKSKYGQRENWIFCPEKDELELSFNGGSAANVLLNGQPSFRASRGIQFIRDWPVGEVEGCSEAVYVRDKYVPTHFVESVNQDVVNQNVTEISRYFHTKAPNLSYDLNGASALAFVSGFKQGDRFYTNGRVPSRLMFSDFNKMSRTRTEGEGELFVFNDDDSMTYRLNGTATLIVEDSVSYRSVDRSVTIGNVKARNSGSFDTLHALASTALRVLTTDLFNGYYSNMVPAIMAERGLELKQSQMKALDRTSNTFFTKNYVKIELDYALISRFKSNALLWKTYGHLFPAEEIFKMRNREMFVRHDIVEIERNVTKLHVNAIKYSFPGVPVVKDVLKYLDGTVTENDMRRMRSQSRGIDVLNILMNVIVEANGFKSNDGVLIGDAHLAIRVMCLQLLITELRKYDDNSTAAALEGELRLSAIVSNDTIHNVKNKGNV